MSPARVHFVLLSLLGACGGAPPDAETPPVAAPAAAPETPAAEAPAAAPAASFELRCTSDQATLEVTGASLRLATGGPHRAERRWNELAGQFRFNAGAITRVGELEGVRDADYAFVMASSTAKQQDIAEVELTGGTPDGKSFILVWVTDGVEITDSGHRLPKRASAAATCSGTLLTAQPAE
ncbi:MAG TPA: hypothetical protein VMZ28_22215 [Kofleriaceae bacterium]|nr:hypothetical protein [Kofleriaceae bacterium]